MFRLSRKLLAFGILFPLFGCAYPLSAGENTERVVVTELYSGQFCGNYSKDGGSLKWIIDPAELQRVYNALDKRALGLKPVKVPDVDFSKDGVLLINMGMKPTTGFAIKGTGESALVKGGEVIVNTAWEEPGPGDVLPQVVTSPCLIIKFKTGDYSLIRVIDNEGLERVKRFLKK